MGEKITFIYHLDLSVLLDWFLLQINFKKLNW